MVQDAINPWAAFRFALAYPDRHHLELFREQFQGTPASLEELRAQYIDLFEAGLPHPRCPLLEGHYLLNRPVGEVVLENKLFFEHFGLRLQSQAAPDHLLTQLEFLSWIEHCLLAGNPDQESLERARNDFVLRHLAHWVPRAAQALDARGAGCYTALFALLARHVEEIVAKTNAKQTLSLP